MTSVLITGSNGNLGLKLLRFLSKAPWCSRIVAVDRPESFKDESVFSLNKVKAVPLNLESAAPDFLAEIIQDCNTLVHFAVTNPLPDATWQEASRSFSMTSRLLFASRDVDLERFIFASSNHVLGALKERAARLSPNSLTVDLVEPGTRWETLHGVIDGYAYGAAKAFSERMCVEGAQTTGISTISIRVGWCQVGENHPCTINAGGNPQISASGEQSSSTESDLRWFRNMWLSNRDFESIFEKAILADSDDWPSPGIVINGVSGNSGMAWEIESAERLIGYRPVDNVWDYVEEI